MGDDIPPGEINHQTAMGQNFGFPWYGGGDVRTNEYKDEEPPADVVFPAVETVAHAADLGMMFYTGTCSRRSIENAIFSAQHGSWNRTKPVGARVMVTTIDEEGNATTEPFAEGWLDENGEYLGPAGRRGAAARRLDPGLGRPRRRALPHQLHRRRSEPSVHRPRSRALRGVASPRSAPWRPRGRRAVAAQDSRRRPQGRAGMCRTCHGLDGLAQIPVAPNIGGEPADYLSAPAARVPVGRAARTR